MDDEDFICPLAWKWTEIHQNLQAAWVAKITELTGAAPSGRPAHGDDPGVAAPEYPIPEPPHLLSPSSNDAARKLRWQETVDWAREFGFADRIPTLAEHECYFRN